MDRLTQVDSVLVQQEERFSSVRSGPRPPLAYWVKGSRGERLLHVEETGTTALARFVIGSFRAMGLAATRPDGSQAFTALRRFRPIYGRMDVADHDGVAMGSVVGAFALFGNAYRVQGAHGQVLMEIRSWRTDPWVFRVLQDGEEVGRIEKIVRNVIREVSRGFDDFRVSFPAGADLRLRTLLVAATLLIDIDHFE